jgi:hypothetical protein
MWHALLALAAEEAAAAVAAPNPGSLRTSKARPAKAAPAPAAKTTIAPSVATGGLTITAAAPRRDSSSAGPWAS